MTQPQPHLLLYRADREVGFTSIESFQLMLRTPECGSRLPPKNPPIYRFRHFPYTLEASSLPPAVSLRCPIAYSVGRVTNPRREKECANATANNSNERQDKLPSSADFLPLSMLNYRNDQPQIPRPHSRAVEGPTKDKML